MLKVKLRVVRRQSTHTLRRSIYSTTCLLMTSAGIVIAPPVHRIPEGTRSLERAWFCKSIPVLAARVSAPKTGSFLSAIKKSALDIPRTRNVVPDEQSSEHRLVLLSHRSEDELPPGIVDTIKKEGATLTNHMVELDYKYWTADDILRATLPQELCEGSPSGFAVMGHLAHLNLDKEYLPYKYIIGQVILDKNPRIRTVVNKLDTIHNQFRVFDMGLIAGEPDFVVQHSESNCRFTFDFREVYWNSRLHMEHDRLVRLLQPEDGIVADVMAGVGPFAIPAARKGCAVLANDLNPNSVKWLAKNVTDNNVSSNLRVYCEDGRDFIRSSLKRAAAEPFPGFTGGAKSKRQQQREERKNRQKGDTNNTHKNLTRSEAPVRNRISQFIMNLPDSAIEFLDAFQGFMDDDGEEVGKLYKSMPLVHCYCFTRFLNPREAEADIRQRVEAALGGKLEQEVSSHYVRSVAPNKDMYCTSFRLPRNVAIRKKSTA